MRKVGIVGGETHIGEVTNRGGRDLELVGAVVRPEQADWARQTFDCPLFGDYRQLWTEAGADIIAVANENDRRAEVVRAALEAGCDVIADKPLALTPAEQEAIEAVLAGRGQERLLMLLTLRGQPQYQGLRAAVAAGEIGAPAFVHIRMAVRLKRAERPPWFLDARRSGGLFLDLLIHGLDQVEWLTGRRIVALTANTGNLGYPEDANLRDHAAVYCELDNGGSAVVEGQRMLPATRGSDYRVLIAGTRGYGELTLPGAAITLTNPDGAERRITDLPAAVSVVGDWLNGGGVVPQAEALRANRLAILATLAAERQERMSAK